MRLVATAPLALEQAPGTPDALQIQPHLPLEHLGLGCMTLLRWPHIRQGTFELALNVVGAAPVQVLQLQEAMEVDHPAQSLVQGLSEARGVWAMLPALAAKLYYTLNSPPKVRFDSPTV